MVKPSGDYHPPAGWVKFETLQPGAKFHNVERPGMPTQYIKLQSDTGTYAVNTDNGLPVVFDLDEFVYPVDNGWIAELACFGFKKEELEARMAQGGHRAVIAYVMTNCEARKADNRWRKEIEKYFPHLAVMSFAGAKRTIEWLMEQVKRKEGRMLLQGTALGDINVQTTGTDERSIEDAKKFIADLVANHQVYEGDGPVPPGCTHRVVLENGVRTLRRVGFIVG